MAGSGVSDQVAPQFTAQHIVNATEAGWHRSHLELMCYLVALREETTPERVGEWPDADVGQAIEALTPLLGEYGKWDAEQKRYTLGSPLTLDDGRELTHLDFHELKVRDLFVGSGKGLEDTSERLAKITRQPVATILQLGAADYLDAVRWARPFACPETQLATFLSASPGRVVSPAAKP